MFVVQASAGPPIGCSMFKVRSLRSPPPEGPGVGSHVRCSMLGVPPRLALFPLRPPPSAAVIRRPSSGLRPLRRPVVHFYFQLSKFLLFPLWSVSDDSLALVYYLARHSRAVAAITEGELDVLSEELLTTFLVNRDSATRRTRRFAV